MMGAPELVTVMVIKEELAHFAKNPDQIRFLLGGFECSPLKKYVGIDYINQAVDFIVNNRIEVGPYYELDIKRRPFVAVVSSGAEEQQYLGDYGDETKLSYTILQPNIYATFDIKSAKDDIIYVSSALKIEEKIWINVIVTNGQQTARVKGIHVVEGKDTEILLNQSMPLGTLLKGWKAQSLPREKGAEILSSMDKVTIQANFTSTGQASIHRLLSIIIRACLKRGRQTFEAYGLQTPTYSYTPLIMNDDTELEFQTVFTIETRVSDSWINKEYELNDDTKQVVIHPVIAVPIDTERDDEVVLE